MNELSYFGLEDFGQEEPKVQAFSLFYLALTLTRRLIFELSPSMFLLKRFGNAIEALVNKAFFL